MLDANLQPTKRDLECLEFTVLDHTIVIKSILGCASSPDDMGHGKDIVKRLIQFVESLPEKYNLVVEYDVSRITIHHKVFPLYAIKLLTTGKSWYNSLGFFEDNYVQNSECIQNCISKSQSGSGKPPKSVQQYFTEIVTKLMELSKKSRDELSDADVTYITQMHTKIMNKYKDLEKTCHLTANNKLSELLYMKSVVGGRRRSSRRKPT